MAKKEDKKGLFDKAVDALSSRDEKEKISDLQAELAQAKKEAEASQQALKNLMNKNMAAKVDKREVESEAKAAEKKIAELEQKLAYFMEKDRERLAEDRKKMLEERQARLEASRKQAAEPVIMKTHKVEAGETLSHIALKYYNHATPPYWKLLLEHNTEILKGSEKNVRTGMELVIPELPEELKD
jgi:nucleoid-associated protein YgaU